jgi:hypothetical protein
MRPASEREGGTNALAPAAHSRDQLFSGSIGLLGIAEEDDLAGGRTAFFGTLRGDLHGMPKDAAGLRFIVFSR